MSYFSTLNWKSEQLNSKLSFFVFQNFPLDNQKVRLSVNGFLCAFEIPVPGSPTSLSSPTLTGAADHPHRYS